MRKLISIFLILCVIAAVVTFTGCSPEANDDLKLNTEFPAPENLGDGNGKSTKVIVLLGQSNATGVALNSYLKANVGEEKYAAYERGFSNVLINFSLDNQTNTSNGEFVITTIGCGHKDEYFGPELGIAEMLSNEYPDETIVILKYTYSGSCLRTQWLDQHKRGDLYNACVKFTTTYMDALLANNYDAKIGAICWMQGESDAFGEAAEEYYRNQSLFVSYLRDDLSKYANDGGIYFIDAGIADISLWPEHVTINDAKMRFAQDSPLNFYFSTIDAGLTTEYEPQEEPDIAHYDSLSALKLGHLFGEYIIDAYHASKQD